MKVCQPVRGNSAVTARREPNPNSESVDNYLKAILLLGGPEEHRVASNALARSLRVAPASVTNMLQKLAAGDRSRRLQKVANSKYAVPAVQRCFERMLAPG